MRTEAASGFGAESGPCASASLLWPVVNNPCWGLIEVSD